MELMKKGLTKWALVGIVTIAILGLTACSRNPENTRAFGVEDLPEWLRVSQSDEEWEDFLNAMSSAELEYFFTQGAGAMQEQPDFQMPEGSRVISVGGEDFLNDIKEMLPTLTIERAEEVLNNLAPLISSEELEALRNHLDNFGNQN